MSITATHINYYHICHRKLWLHANEIRMEHTSDIVAEGKLIGEHSYPQRSEKYTEVLIDGIKIDFYDAKNKIVHEIKKSDKIEAAHEAQVKYYLYKLSKIGIPDATAIIEYPTLRHTTHVVLESHEITEIETWENDILRIIDAEEMPPIIHKPLCKKCSYYEFCYV